MVATLLLNNRMDTQSKLKSLTEKTDSPIDVLTQAGINEIKFAKLAGVSVTTVSLLSKFLGESPAVLNRLIRDNLQQFTELGLQQVKDFDQLGELFQELGESSQGAKAALSRYGSFAMLSRRCVFVLAIATKSDRAKLVRELAVLPAPAKPMILSDVWRELGLSPRPRTTTKPVTPTETNGKKPETKKVSTRKSNLKHVKPAVISKSNVSKGRSQRKVIDEVTQDVKPQATLVNQTSETVTLPKITKVDPVSPTVPVAFNWNSASALSLDALANLRRTEADRLRKIADRLEAEANALDEANQIVSETYGELA